MMPASKHLDIVTGIDIHIIQPPGPVPPVPVPHPFIGFLFDSGDYNVMAKAMGALAAMGVDFSPLMQVAKAIGEALPDMPEEITEMINQVKGAANQMGLHAQAPSTVWVNHLPRARAGTIGSNKPAHIPMGGVFAKGMVGNACEAFMGSATVIVDKEPFTYATLPALSCQCIGMPAPPRGGKTKQMGFFLPTSIVLPIPMGSLVLVGGPPTVSMSVLAAKAFAAGLSKLRSSKMMRGISRKIHKGAGKLMNGLKIPPNSFIRNLVHRGVCAITGHPVDIATGKVFTDHIDFELPGPVPLRWERVWYSTSVYQGPLGYGWHHSYDMALAMDTASQTLVVRMADGRPVIFPMLEAGGSFYNRQEQLTLLRDERGYALRNKERLLYRFEESNSQETEAHPLTSVEDAHGFAIHFSYDPAGLLTQIRDSANRTLRVKNDENGRIQTIYAPHPVYEGENFPIVSYQYDKAGNLTAVKDALQQPFIYQYDQHLLIRETNRNGLNFYFEYDSKDENARCIHTWGDGGIYNHRLFYDTKAKVTIVENSLGHRSQHHYNEMGLVYKTVDAQGNIKTTTYDTDCQVVSETNELGMTTRYSYDAQGNRTLIMAPDGAMTRLEYNADDLLVKAVDAAGGQWQWQYNGQGNLTQREDPLGRKTFFDYEHGLLARVMDPAGGVTQLQYDAFLNPSHLMTPDEQVTQWSYDRLGRCVAVTDPKGNVQRRKFDLLGRIIQVEEPDGNQRMLGYDREDNIIKARDRHHDVRFEYAGMNRMIARIEADTRVEFHYDTEEQLVGIKNEHGFVYRFALDSQGEVVVETGFDGITRKYNRDAAGQVIEVVRPQGRLTQYEYDPVGRVTLVKYADGSSEKYAYRKDGELMQAGNEAVIIRFERDLLGQVLKEVQGEHSIESAYDTLGRRISLTSSLGARLAFERNLMGDVEKIAAQNQHTAWEAHMKRDMMGLELERTLPGGIHSRWHRDPLGRPVHHKITGHGYTYQDKKYVWDVSDRLKQVIDAQKGVTKYEHDVFGNLASAQYADGTFEYRMPDAVGNLFRRKDRKDRKYGPAGQLLEAEGTRYTYDAEGNLVKKTMPNGKTWRYTWNAAGMLATITRPDNIQISFTYDALGRRLSKTYKGKTTRWVWDGNNLLHEWVEEAPAPGVSDGKYKLWQSILEIVRAEQQATLEVTAPINGPPANNQPEEVITWVFEPESFAPAAKLQGAQQYSIVTDYLGTPSNLYDEHGKQVWAADLSIYGQLRNVQEEHSACPFRYPGQYEDEETGLYYNRFRYYDPEGGEYLSKDPISLHGGFNLYSYTLDPLFWIDPEGLAKKKGGCGRAWLNFAKIWHDKRASAIFGKGKKFKGRSVGGRHYDKRYKGRDIEYKSDNFSRGPRSKESLDRMNTQLDKDIANRQTGAADPHWHFEHDPTKAPEMKPVLDKLDQAGISWSHGPAATF